MLSERTFGRVPADGRVRLWSKEKIVLRVWSEPENMAGAVTFKAAARTEHSRLWDQLRYTHNQAIGLARLPPEAVGSLLLTVDGTICQQITCRDDEDTPSTWLECQGVILLWR